MGIIRGVCLFVLYFLDYLNLILTFEFFRLKEFCFLCSLISNVPAVVTLANSLIIYKFKVINMLSTPILRILVVVNFITLCIF